MDYQFALRSIFPHISDIPLIMAQTHCPMECGKLLFAGLKVKSLHETRFIETYRKTYMLKELIWINYLSTAYHLQTFHTKFPLHSYIHVERIHTWKNYLSTAYHLQTFHTKFPLHNYLP